MKLYNCALDKKQKINLFYISLMRLCLCKYVSVFYLNSSISVTAPNSHKNGLHFILIVHFRHSTNYK